MDCTLAGGKVQKLLLGRVGAREVTLLQVRVPGETVYVLVASGYGAGLVDGSQRDRLRARMVANAGANAGGPAAGPAGLQTLWRNRLDGASLLSIGPEEATFDGQGGHVRAAARGPLLTWTPAEPRPQEANSDSDATPAPARPTTSDGVALIEFVGAHDPSSGQASEAARGNPGDGFRESLRARGTEIAEALLRADLGARREALRRALSKALARIERRIEAVERDRAKMDEAQAISRRAQLFVAEAARAPRGATELHAIDWSSGQATPTRWPLDPAKTAQSQIEAAFHRARRMKSASGLVAERLQAAKAARDTLSALASVLERPEETFGPEEWSDLESRARAAAPLDFKLSGGAPDPRGAFSPLSRRAATTAAGAADTRARPPYRTFIGPSKRPILVGRSAEHNDALTLRVARPHDLWLHAKGWTGAHVVVPLEKGATCPPDTLVEAAHLAAHFSDARGETVVEVTYTPRRYVRKPRASAPGSVVVDREKIIVLRSRPDTLRELLAGET